MRFSARLLVCVAIVSILVACAGQRSQSGVQSRLITDATSTASNLMVGRGLYQSGTLEGFERALSPRTFRFPDDFGPHPSFKLEWWYYTGNLQSNDGRRFGYQFTIFRQGLVPPKPANSETPTSAWRSTEGYLAHFAITDVSGRTYRQSYRVARGGQIGLAGSQAQPYRVWVEDWSASGDDHQMKLQAVDSEQGKSINLTLNAVKLPVLQGNEGLSQKSEGNASYYFSLPRLDTQGTITLDGQVIPVSGLSWMDREWSTSTLGSNIGWDWFSLQLDNGDDIMWYQLRQSDGMPSRLSQGSIVDKAGKKTPMAFGDVQISVLNTWTSSKTKAVYPSRWKMLIPSRNIELEIQPLLQDQEIPENYVYWEGAVKFSGRSEGRDVSGFGYVELTGYITEGLNR